jgi:DNA repair exonuclease SbcCD nuclease subunit
MKKKSAQKSSGLKCLVIGDPHFRRNYILDGEEFASKSVLKAQELNPDFIVVMGDTLDTFETVHVPTHRIAVKWLDELSEIAHVYLLIGNHDYINASQFLSDMHIFTPLKKWKNLTVVDKPIYREYREKSFVFCPYVEKGRLIEALDTLLSEEEQMWEMADCVFCHQEIRGCQMGGKISSDGDEWSEEYPPLICGHIHNSQIFGNVYMPGSAYQHSYGDTPNKKLWMVNFDSDEDIGFDIEEVDLGMRIKKTVRMNIEDVKNFNPKLVRKHDVKLTLKGTSEQFRVFRDGETYKSLRSNGVKFSYVKLASEPEEESSSKKTRGETTYMSVLKKVVESKNRNIQKIYRDVVGEELEESHEGVKFIFVNDTDDESALIEDGVIFTYHTDDEE